MSISRFVLVLGMAPALTAVAQEPNLDLELTPPAVTRWMDAFRNADRQLAALRQALDGTPARGGSTAAPAERWVAIPDVQIEKSREDQQKALRAQLEHHRREQNNLAEAMRRDLRLYVSLSVDKCKQAVAAKDETTARANCVIAERRMAYCRSTVEPAVNAKADGLTMNYKRLYGDIGDFSNSKLACDLVFKGLDDPSAILRRADLRIADSSCYMHAGKVVEFARSGTVKSVMGADDASVPAYLGFIRRKCPEPIAAQAEREVAAASAKPAAAARAAQEEEPVLDLPPSRGGNSATAQFREINNTAASDERAPGARDARLRAEQAAQAEQARAIAANPSSTDQLLSALMLGAQVAAAVQGVRNPGDPLAAAINQMSGNQGRADPAAGSASGDASYPAPSGSGDCSSVVNSLSGPANDGNPGADPQAVQRYRPAQLREQDVWIGQQYLRVANAHPACAADSATRQRVAEVLANTQAQCRQQGGASCTTGRNYGVNEARLEAAIQQVMREGASGGGAAASAASGGGDCATAVANQESWFQQLNASRPPSTTAVPTMQMALFMVDERQKLLNQKCRGQPQYREHASLESTKGHLMRNCTAVATSTSMCRPNKAW